jgi:hypothetical protein
MSISSPGAKSGGTRLGKARVAPLRDAACDLIHSAEAFVRPAPTYSALAGHAGAETRRPPLSRRNKPRRNTTVAELDYVKTSSFRTYTGPGRISIARFAPRGHPAGYRVYSKLAPGPWFNKVSNEE